MTYVTTLDFPTYFTTQIDADSLPIDVEVYTRIAIASGIVTYTVVDVDTETAYHFNRLADAIAYINDNYVDAQISYRYYAATSRQS